ncbi:DUF6445 family protein [Thalassotalea sp. PS06]|uniref:DUF6445 family protein n=1 Tax=Thalassotalea sp. PS06 TaxID=2594005 RepID=UPI00116435CC|nr:DUF6445 family protein [Thalassotalea sp. PS06]QDP00461.1 hypothetical protein FNC98_03300 [Thalassotalea sp. PS06]
MQPIADINADFTPEVIRVGNEQTPVIIIDDFLSSSTVLEELAQQISFEPDKFSLYPGVRAKIPPEYYVPLLQAVYQGIYKVYQVPRTLRLKPMDAYLSLLSTEQENLQLLQRMPHFDTERPFYFAVLIYLNNGVHGDTGLFRHKPSGFERIHQNRFQTYQNYRQQHLQQFGEPESQYITASNDQYELYQRLEYKPNRLVIYPGNLLHSTIVDIDRDIDANPQTGRLTCNLFVEFV